MSTTTETLASETLASDPPSADPGPASSIDIERADAAASDLIKSSMVAAMGLGLVPLPGLDVVAIIGVQAHMVYRLGQIYDVPLRENAVKAVVMSVVGGILPVALAGGFVSALKIIPGLGSLAGVAGVSILGGGLTYAVGRVFQQQIENHGSLTGLDIAKARAAVRRELEPGIRMARSLRQKRRGPGSGDADAAAEA